MGKHIETILIVRVRRIHETGSITEAPLEVRRSDIEAAAKAYADTSRGLPELAGCMDNKKFDAYMACFDHLQQLIKTK